MNEKTTKYVIIFSWCALILSLIGNIIFFMHMTSGPNGVYIKFMFIPGVYLVTIIGRILSNVLLLLIAYRLERSDKTNFLIISIWGVLAVNGSIKIISEISQGIYGAPIEYWLYIGCYFLFVVLCVCTIISIIRKKNKRTLLNSTSVYYVILSIGEIIIDAHLWGRYIETGLYPMFLKTVGCIGTVLQACVLFFLVILVYNTKNVSK